MSSDRNPFFYLAPMWLSVTAQSLTNRGLGSYHTIHTVSTCYFYPGYSKRNCCHRGLIWLPQCCESFSGRLKPLGYNLVPTRVGTACGISFHVSACPTCCMFPCLCLPVCLLVWLSICLNVWSSLLSRPQFLCLVCFSPSFLPYLLSSFRPSHPPKLSSFLLLSFSLPVSLSVFVSVSLSEVWPRETYCDRLWKVEVTLLCQTRALC